MRKRMLLYGIVLGLGTSFLTACGTTKEEKIGTGDITKENISQVCDILNEAGLSNVDVFADWVEDSASDSLTETADTNGFTDADCRMTVMLLAKDIIKYDSVEEKYTGDYLMFDVDAIENNESYSILKEKERLFTTMFGEMPISESGFSDALSYNWEKYGIRVDSERCSIISILFKAYEQETAFVGHTGILIDTHESNYVDSGYVFIEKIAFGEPFKLTLVDDVSELVEIFSGRSDYTVEEGDPDPVVYNNKEIIGELNK